MQAMSSGNEETISKATAVFGEFFDPLVTEDEDEDNDSSTTTVRNDDGNKSSNLYFCFNDDLIQVFRNKNNDKDNSTTSMLQVSLEDLGRLAPVKQVKHVLSCTYKSNPVLIIVASFSSAKEEEDGHNTIFWFDVFSETLKLVALDEPLTGVICSLSAMHTPMEVQSSSVDAHEDQDHAKALRHVLAFGMQDGSIQVIMLEYPVEDDVVRTSSTTVKASELDGTPVTSVDLVPPNIHATDSRKNQNLVYLNHALLIAGTIRGLLIHLLIHSLDAIQIKRPNRLKRHTAYEEGAITRITALRDSKKETKCILAVGQDSSLDVGRTTTQGFNKQACVNIIELYANNKKKWLFVIRPNKLNEMCEITAMRLIPAPVGYSIIIAFRAINGNASEIVCHTILSSRKGQLDFAVTISGSEWLLDAYPSKDTCLALTQQSLVQDLNDPNVSWYDRLLSVDSCGNVETADSATGSKDGINNMGSLMVANSSQYSRGSSVESHSQATTATTDYDSTASVVSVELGYTQENQGGINTQEMLLTEIQDDAGDISVLEQQLDDILEAVNAPSPEEMLPADDHPSQETVRAEPLQHVVEQRTVTTDEETYVDQEQQIAMQETKTVTETRQSETRDADITDSYDEETVDVEIQDELMEDVEEATSSAREGYEDGLLENDSTVDESGLLHHQRGTHLVETDNDNTVTTSINPELEVQSHIVPFTTAEPASDTSISSEDEEAYPTMTEKRRGGGDVSPDTSGTEESDYKEPQVICEQRHSDLEQDGSESDSKDDSESQSGVPAALNDQLSTPLIEEQATLSLPLSLSFSAPFTQESPSPPLLTQPSSQQQQEQRASPSAHTLASADNSSTIWSSFATTIAPSSNTSPSPKMLLVTDYDSTSPSPLRLSDDDNPPLSSPYAHVRMSPQETTETDSQLLPDYDYSCDDHNSTVPVYSPPVIQKPQLPIRRQEAVDDQLFIDRILQDLDHGYDKSYPNVGDKLELLLARPADKQEPNYQAHTFARYYLRLRDSGDEVTTTSLIHISEADANLVTAFWLFDRCEYTRALTYLRSEECSTSSYDFKIMKTLEKGLGVQKARQCLEEIEATRGSNAVFQPIAWVHFLRDISLATALKYIKTTPRDMDTRNNLIDVVCKDLFKGAAVPSPQQVRDLAVFDHNEEQRKRIYLFAKSMDTVASKTLCMYLHLKTDRREQFGEAVILNRALQAVKPEAGLLSAEEEALYQRCQELEEKVYSHEPKSARHFLPEWYFFPPGQAKPPYDKLFRENRLKVGAMLMNNAMEKKMAGAVDSNKRPRQEEEDDGREQEGICTKARRM